MPSSRTWHLAGPILAGLAAISCSGAQSQGPAPEIPRPPETAAAPPPAAPVGPAMLPAQVLAQVDDELAMPSFARRNDGGLLFFASHGHWQTRPVDADGKPKSAAPIEVAPLGADVTMDSIKAVGDGYLAVWVESPSKNNVIKVLSIDADGKARGEPVTVTQITEAMSWVDVLPNDRGALVMWDVQHDERYDVFAAPWAAGKIEGNPAAVVRDVIGYEVEATSKGAAIAIVSPGGSGAPAAAPKGKRGGGGKGAHAVVVQEAPVGRLGKVLFLEVDDKAKASAPVTVSAEPTAQIDVTLAEVGGKMVLAWTDERNIDACVYVAAVDPGGKIATPPHRATAPFGEQALVSLVAEPYGPGAPRSKRALLAWEDQLRVQREGRLIHMATIGPDGSLGKERSTLIFSASGPPDIEPDGDGFAAVTLAPVRDLPAGVEVRTQQGAPIWPAFVRLGPDLAITASEPLRADVFASNDSVPFLTRGLACGGGACTTLGVGAVTPARGPEQPAEAAPIVLFSLVKREHPWKPAAFREADEAAPRASSVTALFDGDHLAHVAASDVPGGGAMAAWVTYVVEAASAHTLTNKKAKAPPREEDGPSATLSVRPLAADGTPGKPVVISKKAVSTGGVALASAPAARDGKKPEIALAWVARERGEPQVFVTKLGPDGEKLAQKGVTVVTRKKKGAPTSEAADVAIAYTGGEGAGGDGWITAWVDTRDGNAEIYAARLDRSLNKSIPDRRITEAKGDSVEVQLLVAGKDVFLVWSDARSDPDEGNGDIYLAKLDAATLKKAGPEVRLFASTTHSRTPQITPAGKGFVVSWIEEGSDAAKSADGGGGGGNDAGLRVALLDEKGALVGTPQLVHGPQGEGAVTSAAVGCSSRLCRGVITNAVGEALTLGAFEMTPGNPPSTVKTIAALTGAQDASPVFSSPAATSLFFADIAVGGSGRVRWMKIAWP